MSPSSERPLVWWLNRLAVASLIGLIGLCLAWEWRLAPLRSGGSWLALKALPLAVALPGILRAQRYTHQLATLLILPYLAESVVRGMTDKGFSATLAVIELILAVLFFVATVGYARLTRPIRNQDPAE